MVSRVRNNGRAARGPSSTAVFSAASALADGWSSATLSKFAVDGELTRLGRGIYARSDLVPTNSIDALVVAVAAPQAVFSGATALHLRGLVRWAPPVVFISVRRGSARPTSAVSPVRVRWVGREDVDDDVGLLRCGGRDVLVCSPARAAAELFADRHALGSTLCASTIRELWSLGAVRADDILRHAHRLRCDAPMRSLLESICGY